MEREPDFARSFEARLASALGDSLAGLPETGATGSGGPGPLLVAVSGGGDSTALLAALSGIKDWKLTACHVNHHRRGKESDDDERFCLSLCESFGIELAVAHSRQEESDENSLRESRYRLLQDEARRAGASLIVTGHTLDDQIETMLFRLFRGTAPAGLTGMKPLRELSPGSGLYIVRPLLAKTRKECLAYLLERGLEWRSDSSNESREYRRNYIRHQIVPLIESRFSGFRGSLSRLRTLIEDEQDFMDRLARELRAQVEKRGENDSLTWSLERFSVAHLALRRRLIRLALADIDVEPDYERISLILELAEGFSGQESFSLNRDWSVARQGANLVFHRLESPDEPSEFQLSRNTEIRVPEGPGSASTVITWLDASLRVTALEAETRAENGFPPAGALCALVDLSRVEPPLCVRYRRPGDRIQPFGMSESVRLKQFLHTHKPVSGPLDPGDFDLQGDRPATVVLADSREVLWVPQVGLSEKLRAGRRPSHRLSWQRLVIDAGTVC
ncbi:MAG: tRNA lysidine(34) synthetase TilS [Candidatus Obscuribacterales bacterium]